MPSVLMPQTYMPADVADLDSVDHLLAASDASAFALVGPEGEVAIPAAVYEVLVQVVGAMKAGRAISVTPQTKKMTTQQAADALGISRPTLIKLIDAGEIPCERVSTRRSLQLEDVMEYRKKRRERQLAAIAATSTDLDDEMDQDDLRQLMAEARRANARRRQVSREG